MFLDGPRNDKLSEHILAGQGLPLTRFLRFLRRGGMGPETQDEACARQARYNLPQQHEVAHTPMPFGEKAFASQAEEVTSCRGKGPNFRARAGGQVSEQAGA